MRERRGHVLATVLFTDIVDSSRLARELGDARWRVLLARHHAIVRRALKRYHGKEIDNAGDGFFATFPDQVDAIRCACVISDNVRELGIEVRAGCHVGQAEIIGRKLGGVTIHAAARVMSEAGPSDVLVSSMLKDLVPGSGFTFSDRGLHQLKGIEGDWHLYAVTSVDARPRAGRSDPDEMIRRREVIKPLPITERRAGRTGIAALGLVLVLGTVAWFTHRPRPIQVQPNSLIQIDPNTNSIVADVPVAEPDAAEVAFVPTTHEVWVLSHHYQVVSVVNTVTHSVQPLSVYAGHAESVVNGYGILYAFRHVWVTGGTDGIEEFDPRTKTPVGDPKTIRGYPAILAEGFHRLWVTMNGPDRVFALNPSNRNIVLRSDPGAGGIANATGYGLVWTANSHSPSRLARVNPRNGTVQRILLSFPVVIEGESLNATGVPSAIAAKLDSIWVSDTRNGFVYRLDPQTCRTVATIPIGGNSPAGHGGIAELDGSIWVTSPGTNAIVRIDPDTNTVISSIPVSYPPSGLVAADGSLWVTVNPNMSSDEETPRSPFRGSTCG